MKSITRTSGSMKPDLEYEYDEFGRRISKKVTGKGSGGVIDLSNIIKTHYVLDADGNTMALYTEQVIPLTSTVFNCTAHDIYGSTRLGVVNEDIDMLTVPTNTNDLEVDFGNKDYELTNHLGNVITTISDRKKSIDGVYTYTGNANGNYTFDGSSFTSVDGTTDYYVADIHSVTDYYAFGQPMPGRNTTIGNSYRYGMNGQEREDEVLGNEGITSAEYWMYDSRIGRRFENDPMTYEWQSPYASFNNNPIFYNDQRGLEGEVGEIAEGGPNKGSEGGTKVGGDDAVKGKQKGRWTKNKDGKLEYERPGDDNGKGNDKKGSKSSDVAGGKQNPNNGSGGIVKPAFIAPAIPWIWGAIESILGLSASEAAIGTAIGVGAKALTYEGDQNDKNWIVYEIHYKTIDVESGKPYPGRETYKYGISGQAFNDDGTHPRPERQVVKLNQNEMFALAEGDYADYRIYSYRIIKAKLSKLEAEFLEQELVNYHYAIHKKQPEGNKRPLADPLKRSRRKKFQKLTKELIKAIFKIVKKANE